MRIAVHEQGTRSEIHVERATVTIGRAVDNDIRLASSLVSRHHCRLEARPDGVWFVDHGSANGSQINGQRVAERRLDPSDIVQVGGVRIEVLDFANTNGAAHGGNTDDDLPVGLRTLTGAARDERDELRVFARIARELLRETDLTALLRQIVDSALQLADGERGFVLLAQPRDDGTQHGEGVSALNVRVARSFDKSDVPVPHSRLSQGIAGRVWTTGEAVITVDASRDERFSGMASVEDLRLRSVLCVPIFVESKVEGVLYVDNRLQQGAFEASDLEMMELFADLSAVAILAARRNAALREQNQRLDASRRQIERLNDQLGRKVRDRDTELAVVRAELGRERGRYDYGAIVGASDGLHKVFQQLDRIIESELPVLVAGDSGTGKELIARAIHFNGPRAQKAFVTENCAALPDTLLESELFGHARGAFTGAHKQKKGLLEQADGGTLFLDEIGDMSTEMQKKLLRVIQEGEFRPVGSDQRIKVDVRLIAASHRDLEAMVRAGTFREDLFYRVNVLNIRLPALRERRDDIPLLADHLLARAAREAGRPVPALTHEVVSTLVAYDWPGNVRELENEMRRLIVLARDEVRLEHLSPNVLERRPLKTGASGASIDPTHVDIRSAVADLERRSIEAALAVASGNKSKAAAELGISRFALQRKLDKYGLDAHKGKVLDEDEDRDEAAGNRDVVPG